MFANFLARWYRESCDLHLKLTELFTLLMGQEVLDYADPEFSCTIVFHIVWARIADMRKYFNDKTPQNIFEWDVLPQV